MLVPRDLVLPTTKCIAKFERYSKYALEMRCTTIFEEKIDEMRCTIIWRENGKMVSFPSAFITYRTYVDPLPSLITTREMLPRIFRFIHISYYRKSSSGPSYSVCVFFALWCCALTVSVRETWVVASCLHLRHQYPAISIQTNTTKARSLTLASFCMQLV